MSEQKPFFSVITPSYNQAAWIEGCIQSVLAQGTDSFEHIIFDNCSTDGTSAIVAKYPHILWRSEKDRGQAHALNKAIEISRGEVICWLNADDQYLPGIFETVRREMSQPGVDVVFGDAQEIYFDGRPASVRSARFDAREDLLFWWEKRTDLLQPSVFFRRTVLDRVGPLREDLHLIMDTELWWRMSEHHRFHYIPQPLALQQRQPESKTIKHVDRIYEEKERVFGPLLREAFAAKRFEHMWARRQVMGRRFLGLAQSAARLNRGLALGFLSRSIGQNPFLLFSIRWWKALLHLLGRFTTAHSPAAGFAA